MPSCAPARCRVGAGPAGRLGCAPGAASPRACAWLCRPARPRLAQTDTCTSLRLARGPRTVWGRSTVRSHRFGARERGGSPLPRTRLGCRCRCRGAPWGMVPLPALRGGKSRPVFAQDAHAHTRTDRDHSGRSPRRVGMHDAAGGGAMGGRWRGGKSGVCWAGSIPLPSTRPTPAQARFATPAARAAPAPLLSQRPDERAHGPARRCRGPKHAAGCARARGASQLQSARSLVGDTPSS